jgi:hypothetical protein
MNPCESRTLLVSSSLLLSRKFRFNVQAKKYVLIEIYKLYAAAAGMGSLQLEIKSSGLLYKMQLNNQYFCCFSISLFYYAMPHPVGV